MTRFEIFKDIISVRKARKVEGRNAKGKREVVPVQDTQRYTEGSVQSFKQCRKLSGQLNAPTVLSK